MNKLIIRSAVSLFVLLCAAGCNNSPLLKAHMSTASRKEADQRWRDVRARVKSQLAQQQLETNDLKGARQSIMEALDLQPQDSKALTLLAKIDLAEGRISAARDALQAASLGGDAGAEWHFVSGLLAQRGGDLQQALTHYHRAIEQSPSEPEYLLAAAEVLVSLGRPAEGLSLAESRLGDFEDDTPLRVFVAETRQLIGMPTAAAEGYREALRASRGAPAIQEQLGLALAASGEYAEAISVLEPLVRQAEHAAPRISVVLPDEPAEDRNGNRATPIQAPPRPGTSGSVRKALAGAYLAMHRPEDAVPILRTWLKENPRDVDGWLLLARCGIAANDWPAVEQCARAMQQLKPNESRGAFVLAYALLRQGRASDAAREAEAFVHIHTNDAAAWCILAEAQRRLGQIEAARSSARHAMRINPDDPVASALARRTGATANVHESPAADEAPESNDSDDLKIGGSPLE